MEKNKIVKEEGTLQTGYKWMAFTEAELERLLFILDESDVTLPSDTALYKKIKTVIKRKS